METVNVQRYHKVKLTVAPGEDNCNVLSRLCTDEAVASGEFDRTDHVVEVAVGLSEEGHFVSAEEGVVEGTYEKKTPSLDLHVDGSTGATRMNNKTNAPMDIWLRLGVFNFNEMH